MQFPVALSRVRIRESPMILISSLPLFPITSISVRDDVGHKDVDWSGGEDSVGYYISNGAVQQIHWAKEANNEWARLKFYDEDGNELSINRGKSYIAFNYPDQTEMN